MHIKNEIFGRTRDGRTVTLYTIKATDGSAVSVMDYGASIVSMRFPDRGGVLRECCLGYPDFPSYETGKDYLGATVGRVCGRISGASFSIHGKAYPVAANDGSNHLHGGPCGFSSKVFTLAGMEDGTLTLQAESPDLEEGYPGHLTLQVRFSLTENHCFSISYEAQADQDTPVSLTNHTYFNLSGEETILDHTLQLDADSYTECGPGNIPTGRILPVHGTPFDFCEAKTLGLDIKKEESSLLLFGGYDHNFCVPGTGFRRFGSLYSPASGICMDLYSDLPGVQVYTGNFLSPMPDLSGKTIRPNGGIALETQYYPDALHQRHFPDIILPAGKKWQSRSAYYFRVVNS